MTIVRIVLAVVCVTPLPSFAQEQCPTPSSSPPPAIETKRAFAAQEFGIITYEIDRTVPQVVKVKLIGEAPIGTYTRDERTPDEELDRVAFNARARGYLTAISHNAEGAYWIVIRDEVEQARGTFATNPMSGTWDDTAAAGRIFERHGRDLRMVEAIRTDLCITGQKTTGVVAPPKAPGDDQPNACDPSSGPGAHQCSGFFSVHGWAGSIFKSVSCRMALDTVQAGCQNSLCKKCCEVLPTCDYFSVGGMVDPSFGDFVVFAHRAGDPCINEVGCHDGPGGYIVAAGSGGTAGSNYTATILPSTPDGVSGIVYFACPYLYSDPPAHWHFLGRTDQPGRVTELPKVEMGVKLLFGVTPYPACPATYLTTGPPIANGDSIVHANMDCASSRISFEQSCAGAGDTDYNDAIIQVVPRP